jgi:tryptophan-rich sensory protein
VIDSRRHWQPVWCAALAAAGVGSLGALLTRLGPWYYRLNKPSWQPPDWLFGPAWTLIFALCALAGVMYWRRISRREDRQWVIAAFALNAFLNTLWTLLFFRLERPDWALYEVGFLWLSIVLLIVLIGRGTLTAATLLLPYVLWVSFAALLNWNIMQLNAPFPNGG